MPVYRLGAQRPVIHPGAWIAPTASVIGEVTIEEGASIWFNAVVRADAEPIVIRAGANVQDGSIVHGGPEPTEIGPGVTIGHGCVIHGARIEEEALIGNGAVVLDGAVIGARAMIGAGSVVTPGSVIPPEHLAVGTPARARGPLTESQWDWVRRNPEEYRRLAGRYAAELVEIPID